jgi:hypothetical protein
MKSLLHCAGKRPVRKLDVQESEAKYWGTWGNLLLRQTASGRWKVKPRKFKRSDGSLSHDKTHGWHSRPGQKEKRRNANRALNKRARQVLKSEMKKEDGI